MDDDVDKYVKQKFQKDILQLEDSIDDSHAKREAFVGWNILGVKEKRKHKKTEREMNLRKDTHGKKKN